MNYVSKTELPTSDLVYFSHSVLFHFRLLQYCAKLLQHRLNVYTNIKEVVRKLQIFEALLSNFRRGMS